jgi:hypothetical protein
LPQPISRDRLAFEAVFPVLVPDDLVDQQHEAGREGLRLLVGRRVRGEIGLEPVVLDEAASTAEGELEVTLGKASAASWSSTRRQLFTGMPGAS